MELDLEQLFAQIAAVKKATEPSKKRKREESQSPPPRPKKYYPGAYQGRLDQSNIIQLLRLFNGRKYYIAVCAIEMKLEDFPIGFGEKGIEVIKSFPLQHRNGKYVLTAFNGLMKKNYPSAFIRGGTGYMIFTQDLIETYKEYILKSINFFAGKEKKEKSIQELQKRIDALEDLLSGTYQALTQTICVLGAK